jgi:hypothetical protein
VIRWNGDDDYPAHPNGAFDTWLRMTADSSVTRLNIVSPPGIPIKTISIHPIAWIGLYGVQLTVRGWIDL